jgi:hypothetical protein
MCAEVSQMTRPVDALTSVIDGPGFRAPMRTRAHEASPGVGAEHGVAHGDAVERRTAELWMTVRS